MENKTELHQTELTVPLLLNSLIGSDRNNAPLRPKMEYDKHQKFVKYGENNDFPQRLIELAHESSVHSAILKTKDTFTFGQGILQSSGFVSRPNYLETWDMLLMKVIVDYNRFGGFALQIKYDEKGSSFATYHVDLSTIRIGELNEFNEPISYKIHPTWKDINRIKPLELKAWTNITDINKGEARILAYYDYIPSMPFYTLPNYFAALDYIRAESKLGKYYNKTISNSFTPSAIITIPNKPDERDRKEFYKNLTNTLSGENNAGNTVVMWSENEKLVPTIVPFDASKNADIYNSVEGIIFQKIISAHRLSSPTLAGVSGSGNLSGNASELITSYILFQYSVITEIRQTILNILNIAAKLNKYDTLQIKELEIIERIRESESANENITIKKNGEKVNLKLSNNHINAFQRILNKLTNGKGK